MAIFTIATGTSSFNGTTQGVVPGDTIRIVSGARGALTISNVQGEDGNPVEIVNYGGQVQIAASDWCGIYFSNCQYIHLDGTGEVGVTYGFRVRNFTNCAIFFAALSENLEADHIEIDGQNTGPAGFRAHSYWSDSPPGGWTADNLVFHDCYIHDTTQEAFYIGQYPDDGPPLGVVHVYDCTLTHIGLDGVQLRQSAAGSTVHDNYMEEIGWRQTQSPDQACAGVSVQRNACVTIYDNVIIEAQKGVEFDGHTAGCVAHHNLIVRPGWWGTITRGEGMMQWTRNSASYYHNTIVDARQNGIYIPDYVSNATIYNNFIVVWGAGYASIDADGVDGGDIYNNETVEDIDDAFFVDASNDDYHLAAGSPAIAAADDGGDCGCYSYDSSPEPVVTVTVTVTVTVVSEY